MRKLVLTTIGVIALTLAAVSVFAQPAPMKRFRHEINPNDIQLIQGANGTQYYKCSIADQRFSPAWWIVVVHYQARGKDYTTQLHPAFDATNKIWTDVVTVYDGRIEWLSTEDLSGQQVFIFLQATDPAS